jgi:hypothetical protein
MRFICAKKKNSRPSRALLRGKITKAARFMTKAAREKQSWSNIARKNAGALSLICQDKESNEQGNAFAHLIMSGDDFYASFIKREFESKLVPEVIEKIPRQYLIRKNKAGSFSPLFIDIGTYWYDDQTAKKNGLFDVVGRRSDGYPSSNANSRIRRLMMRSSMKKSPKLGAPL